jgi:hypothetical protein
MISCTELVRDKEYYIKTYDVQYYKGIIFKGYQAAFDNVNDVPGHRLEVNMIFKQKTTDMRRAPYYLFYEIDYYYDPEKIRENAKKARQQMEERSLNMILKRLINEQFEWS